MLVVDFDPQGFLTRTLGVSEPPPERSALALLDPEADLRSFPVETVSGFDLIGSSMALTRSLRRLTKPTDVFWLRETLAAGHDYDLVLLDTAAALSVYTMNALVACEHVVVPVTPEYQPVVGAEQTWQTARLVKSKLNPALQPPRFLLTQVDARLNRHARYAQYLREKYGGAVLSTPVRTSSSLATATRDGRTVFDARVTTRGALDYATAAAEIGTIVFDTPSPRPLLRRDADGSISLIDLHDDDAQPRVEAVPEIAGAAPAEPAARAHAQEPASRPASPERPAPQPSAPAPARPARDEAAVAEALAEARAIADEVPTTPAHPSAAPSPEPARVTPAPTPAPATSGLSDEAGAAEPPTLALAATPLGVVSAPAPGAWTSLDRL